MGSNTVLPYDKVSAPRFRHGIKDLAGFRIDITLQRNILKTSIWQKVITFHYLNK